jgi:hypothetical protein
VCSSGKSIQIEMQMKKGTKTFPNILLRSKLIMQILFINQIEKKKRSEKGNKMLGEST